MISAIILQGYGRSGGDGGGGPIVVPPGADFAEDLAGWIKLQVGLVVYPGAIPQKVDLPAASYLRQRTEREVALSGKPTGVVNADVRLVVCSTRAAEAASLARQLRVGLAGFTQSPMGGSHVFRFQLDDESEGYTPATNGSDLGRFEVVLDFAVSYRE